MESPPPFHFEIFVRLFERQIKLLNGINDTIKAINSINSRFSFKELDKVEQQFVNLQEEATFLEQVYYKPSVLFTDQEEDQFSKNKEQEAQFLHEYMKINKADALARSQSIFRLFEHLERRISDKRAAVNFHRTAMLSLIAISVSVIAIVVAVTI